MHLILWEFLVTENREEFVRRYGPTGDWARLFARGEGYLGTELWEDSERVGRYLTLDRWRSEGDWARFRDRWQADYDALDRAMSGLSISQTRIGVLRAR